MSYDYLQDKSFLKEIDELNLKEQFVKIVLLDYSERELGEIQGTVVSGSLTIDGTSAMRRTANLTIVTLDKDDPFSYDKSVSINKKVKLYTGFTNTTSKRKDVDIVWFPLGVYVVINSSVSSNTGGRTISLQLKDKMCLLSGECGGIIPAAVTFSEYEVLNDDGEYVIEKPTIYQIIQELVNHYGNEDLNKIIISDIDEEAKQVMKWTGSIPLYLIEGEMDEYSNLSSYSYTTDESLITDNTNYVKYEYGEDVGFTYTSFTYPGELSCDGGATVVTVLDTIKNTLGNFEYYYDVDGNFIFQEIKNYLNTSFATSFLEELNSNDYLFQPRGSEAVYSFEGSKLITSYTNTPQYGNVKNDFVLWGVRETSTGLSIPIRYHLAIDDKPQVGNIYTVWYYTDDEDGLEVAKYPYVLTDKESIPTEGNVTTFYEKDEKFYQWDGTQKKYVENKSAEKITIITTDWRTELYLQGVIAERDGLDSNYYYTELKNEWTKLYDIKKGEWKESVTKELNGIDYFLDFIEGDGTLQEISVNSIGRRSYVENDDQVNCIFEPEIPDLVLIESGTNNTKQEITTCINKGQRYVLVSQGIMGLLAVGGNFYGAFDEIKAILKEKTSYNESISISSLPIYHIEPNTRITVVNQESGINGDYLINSISLPLDSSGTMSMSCSKIIESF